MKNITTSKLEIDYVRVVEDMGKGLVMISLQQMERSFAANYHYFFNNGYKPPLDVAINPCNNTVEYITFFIQDEYVQQSTERIEIVFSDSNITITDSDFCREKYEIQYQVDFSIKLIENDLVVIKKDCSHVLYGYQIGKTNYILLDKNGNISGIVMKNLSDGERKVLESAEVI